MQTKPYSQTSITRLWHAARNSWKGLRHLLGHETAFIQEIWLVAGLLPVIVYLDIVTVEKLILVCSLFLILIVEVLNTAIEAVVDRIGEEYHPLSGLAKDLGSLAVTLSFIMAIVAWVIVLV